MEERNKYLQSSYKEIKEKSLPDFDYFFMLILSSIICFFGFRMNSVAVIIGAMVISPLLFSIIGVGTSIFFSDFKQFVKEIISLLIEISLILFIIFLFGNMFPVEISSEITSRINGLNIDYFFIALLSGIAGSFSLFWPKVEKSLVGVAISVALIPPIVLCGIGLSMFDTALLVDAGKIVVINLFGIGLGSFILLFFLKTIK